MGAGEREKGGGGGGEVPKKQYLCNGKFNEKIHACQITLKIFIMQRPRKDSHKRNAFEKNSCASKIPHPPHNFSNGPSLNRAVTLVEDLCLV